MMAFARPAAAAPLLAMFCALAGAAPAVAQPDDPIARCRTTTRNAEERISCLEATIRTLTGAAVAESAAPPAPAAGPAIPAPAPTVAAADAPADPVEPTGIGAEQVRSRQAAKGEREPDEGGEDDVAAVVTEFAYTSLDHVIFFLDNGQIWRQKQADRNQIRLSKKRKYTVTLSEGAISGYRMTIKELRRTILVERIK